MFNSAKISEQYKKVVNGFESTCFTQKLEILEETFSTESCVTDEHSVLSLMKSQNSDTGEELMTYTLLEYSEGTVEESMFELPEGYAIERLE